tara:strand:+ start:1176 stop:2447 length:1272 start_codon:yes stop_codon:yes gene_type:complete
MDDRNKPSVGTYIDLFSGCGGLSLGLGYAGWQGLFAVEKDPMAFSTFKHNMIDKEGKYAHFNWQKWLPQEATTIQKLLKKYPNQLAKLKGKVDLIAGGPPCQGFSLAGMRNSNDPRNKMSQEYIKMVGIIKPKFLLLENVRGFNAVFKNGVGKAKKIPYSQIVKESIEKLGYKVFKNYVHSEDFGVPQQRTRFIMIGIREDLIKGNEGINPFNLLDDLREGFLKDKGLPQKSVAVKDAISDLETRRRGAKLVEHSGSPVKGFKQLDYQVPDNLTAYQSLMRKGLNGVKPCSMRLARHKQSTIEKFELIQEISRPGVTLSEYEREIVGTRKQAICVLDPKKPSKTITTLPDDILHYKEPRILTVRESARIQSFPDDFKFQGKYTTGGKDRTKECPRYTQVGNAVPPLLGEILGSLISKLQHGRL